MAIATAHQIIIEGPNVSQHAVRAVEGMAPHFSGIFTFDPYWTMTVLDRRAGEELRAEFPMESSIIPNVLSALRETWIIIQDLTSQTLRQNGYLLDVERGELHFTCVTQAVDSRAITEAAEVLVASCLVLCRQEAADYLLNRLVHNSKSPLPTWWASADY